MTEPLSLSLHFQTSVERRRNECVWAQQSLYLLLCPHIRAHLPIPSQLLRLLPPGVQGLFQAIATEPSESPQVKEPHSQHPESPTLGIPCPLDANGDSIASLLGFRVKFFVCLFWFVLLLATS